MLRSDVNKVKKSNDDDYGYDDDVTIIHHLNSAALTATASLAATPSVQSLFHIPFIFSMNLSIGRKLHPFSFFSRIFAEDLYVVYRSTKFVLP